MLASLNSQDLNYLKMGTATNNRKRKTCSPSSVPEEDVERVTKRAKQVNSQSLIEAARKGDIEMCIKSVREGADVKFQSCGLSPLFYASFYGHKIIIEYLVNCGADVNEKNLSGVTPLAKAVESSHSSASHCLLSHGADCNMADAAGNTPMHKACRLSKPNKEIVKLLIDSKTDLDLQNADKNTCLHEAAAKGYDDIILLLVKSGAKVDVKNSSGKTALHRAISANHISSCLILLDHGAFIDAQDSLGFTAMHYACFNGSLAGAKFLTEKMASLTVLNVNKKTPLEVALERRHCEISEYLSRIVHITVPVAPSPA
eukprot:TRINITY_DN68_c1_g1_i5.p1 TRINITY_DN68_c1_g1~~TRINITY_DN68_c1_g1_i5.p1  ORF type:complete len:315 (+),score=74.90 TRINITY_DN68_c1_g1_i5:292-1236(+)